jgi:hypothetical protein
MTVQDFKNNHEGIKDIINLSQTVSTLRFSGLKSGVWIRPKNVGGRLCVGARIDKNWKEPRCNPPGTHTNSLHQNPYLGAGSQDKKT